MTKCCEHCGNEFEKRYYASRSMFARQRFCSKACWYASQRGEPSTQRLTREQAVAEGWFKPNVSGLCECGCGVRTPLAPQSSRRKGWLNGEPTRFCPGHNLRGLSRPSALARFWAKVDVPGNLDHGCWEWTGAKSAGGYGQIGAGGRIIYAHRFAYERLERPLEDSEILHHLCGNPACVNAQHLQPMSQAEHARLHAA